MGLFDFFKKKKEKRKVSFKELDKWIDKEIQTKQVENIITNFREEIVDKIEATKKLMDELENASLLNEKIPERFKHIMKGNREHYIKKVSLFLEDLKLPYNYQSLKKFSKELKESITELSKDTQKSYMILNEFLATELAKVIKSIKDIELATQKAIKSFEKKGLEALGDIKELLEEYAAFKNRASNLKKEEKDKKEQLAVIQKKISEAEKEIKISQDSKKKKEYDELIKTNKLLSEDLRREENELWMHISTLEKALKKYKRVSLNESLIDSYLQNSSQALMNDNKLEFVSLLETMNKSLDKLDLKDKKLEKTKDEINILSNSYLQAKKEKIQKIQTELLSVDKKLDSNKVLSDIENSEHKLHTLITENQNLKLGIAHDKKLLKKDRDKEIVEEIRSLLQSMDVILEDE